MPAPKLDPDDNKPNPDKATTLATLGAELRKLRESAELKQQSFATLRKGMSNSVVSRVENGTTLPPREWLYDYVTHCLSKRRLTDAQLNTERDRWLAAWKRVHSGSLTLTDAAPVTTSASSAVASPANVAVASAQQQAPAGIVPAYGRPSRRLLLVCVPAVVLVAACTAVTTHMLDSSSTALSTPSSSGVPTPGTVHFNGSVVDLRGPEGIDLDNGHRAGQNDPGMDISPAATADGLNAMANRVTFTLLPDVGPVDRERCVKAVDWMRQIPDLYDVTEGRQICVKTDEGRFSMLAITKRSSAANPVMNFSYVTWN